MKFSVLLAMVVGFAVGVVWRTLVTVPLSFVFYLVVIAGALAVVWRRRGSETPSPPFLLPLIIIFVFTALGVLRTEVASWQFGSSPLISSVGSKVTLIGIVTQEPDAREKSLNLNVRVNDDVILVTTDRLTPVSYGDQIEVTSRLDRPESFATELGRTFDYPGYLRAKGIEYRVSFAEVDVLSTGHGNVVVTWLLKGKQHFIESLEHSIPEPEVGLGKGLLLGVKSALGDEIEQDFRRAGIIHIVVLSGYNIMLVVAFFLFCVSFILPFRLRIIVGILTILAFALVVGLSATVIRASVMACLVLFAQLMGRRYHVLRALLLAGFFMVLINPYLLVLDVGFQLSFMATLGLILIIPQFESVATAGGNWFGIREFVLATLATQIAVLPLLMYHIGEVSLIALVVNVLVLPVVPVAMLLTFITGLVGFLSATLASFIGYLATWSLKYILLIADWFAELPLAAVAVPEFPVVWVFVLYALMLVSWYLFSIIKLQSKDPYADWIIEEEPAGETTAVFNTEGSPAGSEDLPIFFR